MYGVSNQVANTTRALKRLQALARRPPSEQRSGRTGRVPADIATEGFATLVLDVEEERAFQELSRSLLMTYGSSTLTSARLKRRCGGSSASVLPTARPIMSGRG